MLPWLEQAYQASADSVRYFPAMAPATRPAWTRTWPAAGLGRRPGRVGGGTGQARWSGPDPLVSLFVTIRLPDCSWPAVTVRRRQDIHHGSAARSWPWGVFTIVIG